VAGKSQVGVEYRWNAGGKTFKVRIHDPDPSITPTSTNPTPNALVGWIVRICRGREYMDPNGQFHPRREVKPGSPDFDEFIANETHIPILPPLVFP
jgi:hypothetical protein